MPGPVAIVGHRGARGLFPENTLTGFQEAHAMGVDVFELDVGLTKDGVAVVSHDPALNPDLTRDRAGHWLRGPTPSIQDLTLEELRAFDVGRIRPLSRYRLRFPRQAPRDGARIPTLVEVLSLSPVARFIVELKTGPANPGTTPDPVRLTEAVLAAIDATGTADRATIESFDWRGPRHARRLRPEIRTAWLTRAETTRDAALWWDIASPTASIPAAIAAEGGQVWAPAHETLTRAGLDAAHALGLTVLPWTVNNRRVMRRLIAWGVDGLITDYPDIATKEADQSDIR